MGEIELRLRDLRYFIAVAEERSFTNAAYKLFTVQGAVSKVIRNLEAEMGAMLFDRATSPITLTQAGVVLLPEAQSIVNNLQQVTETIASISKGRSGYLKVGFTSAMANGILPTILQKFQSKYPDVELILSEANTVEQIRQVQERATDIMFFYEDCRLSTAEDLEVVQIDREMLVVVLPENHSLANRSSIALSELQGERFIMPDPQVVPGLANLIYKLFEEVRVEPHIIQTAVFMVTILGLVAGGIGISILPDTVQKIQREGVVYRPISERTTAHRLSVLWRNDNNSQIVKNFLDLVREVANID